MTQYYKVPGFTLAKANASTKVLISLFLVTVLIGLGVAVLQYYDRAGDFSARAAGQWVLGNEGDFEALRIMPEKSFSELLSITHEHAFSVPILVFVVLHLVGLTSVSERAKIFLYSAGFAATLMTFGAPWLVYAWGSSWTFALRAGGTALTAVLALRSGLCLWELWFAARFRRLRGSPDPPAPDPMFPKLRRQSEEDLGDGP